MMMFRYGRTSVRFLIQQRLTVRIQELFRMKKSLGVNLQLILRNTSLNQMHQLLRH